MCFECIVKKCHPVLFVFLFCMQNRFVYIDLQNPQIDNLKLTYQTNITHQVRLNEDVPHGRIYLVYPETI